MLAPMAAGMGAISSSVKVVITDPVAAMDAPEPVPEPAAEPVPEPVPEPAAEPCAVCSAVLPERARFCPECGSPAGPQAPPDQPPAQPKPEHLLTAEERAARERAHQAAVRLGSRDSREGPYVAVQPGQQSVLVHMVEDGLTAFGKVWFRGQEIEVAVGGPRWEEAQRWILQDDRSQMQRYGRVLFRPGPWPGLPYSAAAQVGQFPQLKSADGKGVVTGPTPEQLATAERAEAARRRGVPAAPRG